MWKKSFAMALGLLMWGGSALADPEVEVLSRQSSDGRMSIALAISDKMNGDLGSLVSITLEAQRTEDGGINLRIADQYCVYDKDGVWLLHHNDEDWHRDEPVTPPFPEGFEPIAIGRPD